MLKRDTLELSLLGDDPNIKIHNFPDGQRLVELLDPSIVNGVNTVNISIKLYSFSDLELLGSLIALLKELRHDVEIRVYCPYLLGARSDRAFTLGTPNYLKFILTTINNMGVDYLQVLDVHNPIAAELELDVDDMTLDNVELDELLSNKKKEFSKYLTEFGIWDKNIVVVSPDAGAVDRANNFAGFLSCYTEKPTTLIKFDKKRSGDSIELSANYSGKYFEENFNNEDTCFLVVDDICDGGKTFTELAKALDERCPKALRYLFVTHGIFSKGADLVNAKYNGIITTNSYDLNLPDFGELDSVKILKVI